MQKLTKMRRVIGWATTGVLCFLACVIIHYFFYWGLSGSVALSPGEAVFYGLIAFVFLAFLYAMRNFTDIPQKALFMMAANSAVFFGITVFTINCWLRCNYIFSLFPDVDYPRLLWHEWHKDLFSFKIALTVALMAGFFLVFVVMFFFRTWSSAAINKLADFIIKAEEHAKNRRSEH